MFSEDNLLPISALQHIMFCPRQCALIHLEQKWSENRLTAEGRILHERVHSLEVSKQRDIVITRGLQVRSLKHGLVGVADVVEFTEAKGGVVLEGLGGKWMPRPVEYKRGRPKKDHCDEVQVCAQALCLEEQLGVRIEDGDLYYGQGRRRAVVTFDQSLRKTTIDTAKQLRLLFDSKCTPQAEKKPHCERCSLKEECLPSMEKRVVRKHMQRAVEELLKE